MNLKSKKTIKKCHLKNENTSTYLQPHPPCLPWQYSHVQRVIHEMVAKLGLYEQGGWSKSPVQSTVAYEMTSTCEHLWKEEDSCIHFSFCHGGQCRISWEQRSHPRWPENWTAWRHWWWYRLAHRCFVNRDEGAARAVPVLLSGTHSESSTSSGRCPVIWEASLAISVTREGLIVLEVVYILKLRHFSMWSMYLQHCS